MKKGNDSHFHSCPKCYVFIITNKCSTINYLLKEWRVFMEKKQNGEIVYSSRANGLV